MCWREPTIVQMELVEEIMNLKGNFRVAEAIKKKHFVDGTHSTNNGGN